jgi:hypothetical protein
MPIVTGTQRTDAAQLHDDVGTLGDFDDGVTPNAKNFIALAGIGADAKRRADVVENDRHIRKRPRQIRDFGQLRMINPSFETKTELGGSETGSPISRQVK